MQPLDVTIPVGTFVLGYLAGRLHRLHKRRRFILIIETDDETEFPGGSDAAG